MRQIRGRNNTKADILVYRLGTLQIALKDYRRRPWWVRQSLARWMTHRETAAYRAAAGIPGVARFLGRLGPVTLATEWVESRSLGELRDQAVDPAVFERLHEILGRLHAAGIALADLHLADVLVDPRGEVTLVDLANAFTLGPRPGPLRSRLFRRLVLQDEISFARLQAHLRQEDAEEAVRELGPRAARINRRNRRIKTWVDRIRGRRHGSPADERPYSRKLGRLRVAVVWLLVGLLVALARPTPSSVFIGIVFVSLGELLRCWAAGHLRKTVRLITSGPYRYTRNPLYLGRLLIFTGISIMATLPFFMNWVVLLAGYAVFFGYYLPRKERVEPARLREAHGARYDAYFDAVPALLPRRTPWPGGSDDGWHSSRLTRNREHWMVLAMALISVFLFWRAY